MSELAVAADVDALLNEYLSPLMSDSENYLVKLGSRLHDAIRVGDYETAERLAKQLAPLDDATVLTRSHPLYSAMYFGQYVIADMLIAHGASPRQILVDSAFRILILSTKPNHRVAVQFLLRRGAIVPEKLLSKIDAIREYVYRNWEPRTHCEWPDAVRPRIRELLMLAQAHRATPVSLLPRLLLERLLRWVAAAGFDFIA